MTSAPPAAPMLFAPSMLKCDDTGVRVAGAAAYFCDMDTKLVGRGESERDGRAMCLEHGWYFASPNPEARKISSLQVESSPLSFLWTAPSLSLPSSPINWYWRPNQKKKRSSAALTSTPCIGRKHEPCKLHRLSQPYLLTTLETFWV